ncbi:UNVERIFIED_CONTAM: SAG-related sequence protein, putative [Hammondia hammondi]|eukprot:XP_008886476.1 SAG-related sequence protein, putative [Hammondia hammondi]
MCAFSQGLSLNLDVDSKKTKVTFRCESASDLLPSNFEKTFKEENCDESTIDTNAVNLTDLKLKASLVEGLSATSTQNTSSTSAAAAVTDLPAYTFEVAEFPKDETKVCYKCIEKTVTKGSPPQDPKKCKIIIKVPAARSEPQAPGSGVPPPPPGDGGNQNPSAPHQQDADSNSGEQSEIPSEPNQKPDGPQTPTDSSAHTSTTGVGILAVLTVFSALPV